MFGIANGSRCHVSGKAASPDLLVEPGNQRRKSAGSERFSEIYRLALPFSCDDFKHRCPEADQVAIGEVEMGELVEMSVEKARMVEKRHHQHRLAQRMAAARAQDVGPLEAIGDRDGVG